MTNSDRRSALQIFGRGWVVIDTLLESEGELTRSQLIDRTGFTGTVFDNHRQALVQSGVIKEVRGGRTVQFSVASEIEEELRSIADYVEGQVRDWDDMGEFLDDHYR